MNKKLLLIVNYNQKYCESETYVSLKQIQNLFDIYNIKKIIFWDNIPKDNNYKIVKELKNCEYIPSKNNKGLAYIYNQVIKNYCKDYEYLVLLDNDSKLDEQYFKKLESVIKSNKEIPLFVPIVKVKDKIYSPNKNIYLFNFYFKEIKNEKIYSKNIFAINSGMCISTNYLVNDFRKYDDRLNFYGTDNYFMNKYQVKEKMLAVFPYIMEHKLSAFDKNEPIDKKLWRFRDVKHSLKIIMEDKKILTKLIYLLYIKLLSLKKAIQYKDKRFFY